MSLYVQTRDLHHACEQHPFGQAMVTGSITRTQWASWLWAMRVLHQVVDAALPDHMDRHGALSADLAVLPKPKHSRTAAEFAAHLIGTDTTGAAYVLHGAHCSGGRVLAPKMAKRGLPTAHTSYALPELVTEWLRDTRELTQHARQARRTFAALLDIMEEIGEA